MEGPCSAPEPLGSIGAPLASHSQPTRKLDRGCSTPPSPAHSAASSLSAHSAFFTNVNFIDGRLNTTPGCRPRMGECTLIPNPRGVRPLALYFSSGGAVDA
ncbi:hypothetical protein NDU88_005717 [Pleurodeles waltl]|uniref:Uncharacterized protein n=1 Tax=Pleurodeles waltl TaxID=8319 RepID=A0AAV7L239_PLEWA|nr:hypothetical protein NDU88_005717 [Pleurodeles waltl]